MSFLSYGLHEQERHAEYFLCSFRNGPCVCLACFLHSLADPSHLDSRKAFTLREFMGLFTSDAAEGSQPLHVLLTQHASILVNGFLTAIANTQDLALAQALHEAAAHMCQCAADFLPELFTERILQLLLELAWPTNSLDPTYTAAVQATAAVASSLQLLQELINTHSSAAGLLARILESSGDLVAVVTGGLGCGVEAVVVPLLHIFSYLAHSSSVAIAAAHTGCLLPASLAKDLFISLLQLLPDLLAPELRMLVVQVLLKLAETGYAVEQVIQPPTAPAHILGSNNQPSQQHSTQQHQALAGTLMSALKPLLLDTNTQLQLLGMQLLVAVVSRASALLLQQLMNADVCEHVYEVLRGTLSSCNMRAQLAAAVLVDEQRRRVPGAAGAAAGGTAASAAAEFEVAAEGLQSAAITTLRFLSSQGPTFLEHFHFGIHTLTDLLQHGTTSANSPLLADTVVLLAEVTAPHNPSSLLLPTAALAKLAAAAVAVLPDAAAATDAGGAAGLCSTAERQHVPGMELQPSPELQAAYEGSCVLLMHLGMKWGGSSSWAALQPHVTAGMHKALAAVSFLSSRSLASGFLAAACKFLRVIGQLMMNAVAAISSHDGGSTDAALDATMVAANQQALQSQGKHKLNSSKRKQPGTTAGVLKDDKPFAKRRQQQRRQSRLSGAAAAGHGSSSTGDLAAQQSSVDDILLLMESLLMHLLPAAGKVLSDASSELAAAAASQQQQQQEGAMFVQLLQAVQGVLIVVLSAGTCSRDLGTFMPAFCSQLLGANRWCSTMWSSMAAHTLPPAVAADAWTVLLQSAAYLEGPAFMTGTTQSAIATLAATLASKVASSLQLLELLCSSSSSSQEAAAATAPQSTYGRNSSRQAAALAAAANTADIRRFCGVADTQKAALCVVAAAIRAGDACWSWLDLCTALNAVVGSAGPGILSQSELLYSVVLLYCQVEQQLAAELASQQYSNSCCDGVMLTDRQQQQQLQQHGVPGGPCSSGSAAAVEAFQLAAQQLPVPDAILHALQKCVKALPELQPGDCIAQWILARSEQLPTAAQQLLQRWMSVLLASSAEAAAAVGPDSNPACTASGNRASQNVAAVVPSEERQEVATGLIAVLTKYPSALNLALQLTKQCIETKQQVQLAAWLTVFTGVLHSTSNSSAFCLQQYSSDEMAYLAAISHQAVVRQSSKGHSSSGTGIDSSSMLANLLIGPCGLLEILRRALLAFSSSAPSSIGASCVVMTCSSALLAAVIAAADGGAEWQCMEQLLQQGTQQVHLAATRILQIPTHHPMHQQLLLSTVNAANALMHTALLQQQDAAVAQQLAECQELHSPVAALAAAAVSDEDNDVATMRTEQSQQWQQRGLECSTEEADLVQLLQCMLAQYGFCSSNGSQPVSAAAECVDTPATMKQALFSPVSRESLLLAALQWRQHQQLACLMGLLPAEIAAPSDNSVFGLSSQHLLVMAQNAGGSLLSLLLLDTTRLLLLQSQATPGDANSNYQQQQQQQWPQLLAVLQNLVVAAATGGSGTLHQEATASCLAALYAAAATSLNSSSGDGPLRALSAAKSAWNMPVIKTVLDRLCQQAAYMKGKAVEAEQAAAAAATKVQPWTSDYGSNADALTAADSSSKVVACMDWVLDPECKQQVQLWCADAHLLLDYIKLVLAVIEYENRAAACADGSNRRRSSSNLGNKMLNKLQQLVMPYLEQQQLAGFLCWAAARLDPVKAAAHVVGPGGMLGQQQHGCQDSYQASQYSMQRQQQAASVHTAAGAAAEQQYCLQLSLCEAGLQLLAGLLDSGCFGGQLPWLHQQLQQQTWAVEQQQQQQPGQLQQSPQSPAGRYKGSIMALSTLEVVNGVSVGLLRSCVVQHLMKAVGRVQYRIGCQMVLDAVALGMQQQVAGS